ncbi:MAG: class I SAM-dependent methyltransferase [Stomatobaculum sp.]
MKRCIACGALLREEPLLIIDNMPAAAQHLPEPEEKDSEHGVSVRLCACRGCGLVQLDSPPVPYYRDVIRSGGYSTTMDQLRRRQYERWIDLCGLKGKKILEAGCGQGEFLKILAEYPVEAYGMEHSPELVKKARAAGLRVAEEYPEEETQRFENAPFDGFTSFNFLEHQPEPAVYLCAIAANLCEEGCGLVTVPSFEYILEQNSFYELIPDHLAYFTMETLEALMNRCGFDVLERERVNRDTLSVIVKKKRAPEIDGLIRKKQEIAEQVEALGARAAAEGRSIAVWGASHQGFTLCAVTGIAAHVRYIIDSAPFKQGKIAPASHLPIVSPEAAKGDPTDIVLIVAPGYTEEIAGILREQFPRAAELWTLRTDRLERL